MFKYILEVEIAFVGIVVNIWKNLRVKVIIILILAGKIGPITNNLSMIFGVVLSMFTLNGLTWVDILVVHIVLDLI